MGARLWRALYEEEGFVVDVVLYREPVKLDENRGDVVWVMIRPGVLNDLQSVDEFGGESAESTAVIDVGCDK